MGGNAVDEATLIRRARSGDREAFGQLVSRHQESVYRVVRGILAGAAECEDVTQEVFLKAYGSLGKFRGDSGLFTWLYRIAVNEALRARRRRPWGTTESLPEVDVSHGDTAFESCRGGFDLELRSQRRIKRALHERLGARVGECA